MAYIYVCSKLVDSYDSGVNYRKLKFLAIDWYPVDSSEKGIQGLHRFIRICWLFGMLQTWTFTSLNYLHLSLNSQADLEHITREYEPYRQQSYFLIHSTPSYIQQRYFAIPDNGRTSEKVNLQHVLAGNVETFDKTFHRSAILVHHAIVVPNNSIRVHVRMLVRSVF